MNKLFLVILLFPLLLSAVNINFEIEVPANVEWFNSGIIVYKNEEVKVLSEGFWQYDPRPNFKTSPDGLSKGKLSLGALRMKCNDDIYLVGSSWNGVIEEDCVLQFGMYDTTPRENNLGSINVYVDVDRTFEEENVEEDESEKVIEKEEKEEDEIEEEEEVDESSMFCSLFILLMFLCLGAFYVHKTK